MRKKIERIPVYLITGFLESGKTSFLNYTLSQDYFMDGQKTLLIVCEEGIEEYDEEKLKKDNVFIEYIEDEKNYTSASLEELGKKYNPERVIVEYNGMWKMDSFIKTRPPYGWEMEQWITTIDATTFAAYSANMKPMIMAMIQDADMVIFNRCTKDMPLEQYRRMLKTYNRKAEYVFEDEEGEMEQVFDEDLPYDVNADVIEVKDDDFMVFYIDLMDRREKYEGKTIIYKGSVLKNPEFPKDVIVPGRLVMTCCADDIQFAGYVCKTPDAALYNNEDWVKVTAKVKFENYGLYGGVGPVFYADKIEKTKEPKNKVLGM